MTDKFNIVAEMAMLDAIDANRVSVGRVARATSAKRMIYHSAQ